MPKHNREIQLGIWVGQRNYRAVRAALSEMNPVDAAYFIENLPAEQGPLVFRTLPKELAMEVFAELEPEYQQEVIEAISDRELAALTEELAVDDAVDMLEEMPAALVKRVLQNASPATRAQLNEFLRYPEHSAGSIMTAEFTDLRRQMTVEEAIKRLRRIGHDKETIYTCYVMDETRVLQGVVTVKDLLLAHDTALVEDIMESDIISVTTTSDQEQAVQIMAKYDLISLPVVDTENRLVGIVTVDDAVDVIQEEATEDFEIMGATRPSEKPYLKTSVLSLTRNRFLWLLVLMVSGMITGSILASFEEAIAVIPLLVQFIPRLTDTGGNAGSQSSTLVIRGMALGELDMHSAGSILWKELRVSVLVGIPLALVNIIFVAILHPGNLMVGITVSLTLFCVVLLANLIGGLLPIVAKLLKADPALMAAPVITTLVDALGLVIYFALAILLLGI